MFNLHKLEVHLLKSRKTITQACFELDIEKPEDIDLLTVDQCSHCGVWHYEYQMIEDLDGNFICQYCESLTGR